MQYLSSQEDYNKVATKSTEIPHGVNYIQMYTCSDADRLGDEMTNSDEPTYLLQLGFWWIISTMSSPVHVAPACVGYGEGSNHFLQITMQSTTLVTNTYSCYLL
jgi:hypothetical protein